MIRIQLKKRQPLRLKKRLKNRARLRKKIAGLSHCPRLSVFRSGRHIYAQLIDDDKGETIVASSSLKMKGKKTRNAVAEEVGKAVAKAALAKKVKSAVFDRGGFIYHGRIKALAEGARVAGLKF